MTYRITSTYKLNMKEKVHDKKGTKVHSFCKQCLHKYLVFLTDS